ncbi:MAG: acyltransferase family protein [Prevotella sp.]|nr:acyltransferase family protein [Prevotella sp.]
MAKERIQYIDAMRGFTMILVIYSHVCVFCFGDYFMAFNKVLFLLRLPCFFFISGWLFYKIERVWDSATVKQVVSNKFMVQIVPTVIFLALHERTHFFHQLGAFKGGYWFTFGLFVYFVLFSLTAWIIKRHRTVVFLLSALLISVAAYWYDVSYQRIAHQLGWGREVLGFMGFVTWRYYLFFVLGAMAKKYFNRFLELTDRHEVQVVVVVLFCIMAALPVTDWWPWAYTRFAVSGICGMVMVFTFFRKFASWFTKEKPLGRSLQYVGTRTLDIYLLHFFFLPESLLSYNRQLLAYNSKWVEIGVVMGEALVVLACCLVVSYILRLSPFLAKYLFGVKQKSVVEKPQ